MLLDLPSFAAGVLSWPFLFYTAVFILLTVEIAYESSFIAFMTLAIVGAIATFFHWIEPHWFLDHWTEVLMYAAVYVPIGVMWAVVKWWFYVREQARRRTDAIMQAKSYESDRGGLSILRKPPQVSEHKSDIMRWMGWWPFSLVGTLLNDPFRRMFEAIYRHLGTFLQKMSDRAFAHLQVQEPEETNDSRPPTPPNAIGMAVRPLRSR